MFGYGLCCFGSTEKDSMDESLKFPVPELKEDQRRLVRENIGLVGIYLRKNVNNLARPRHDREREDLFQEGCLGLIRAAATFEPERGMTFAAFAWPRIHHAVSLALRTKFSNVYVPLRQLRKLRSRDDDHREPHGPRRRPDRANPDDSCRPPFDHGRSGRDARRAACGEPGESPPRLPSGPRAFRRATLDDIVSPSTGDRLGENASRGETVRSRLGEKYERAVREAVEWLGDDRSLRGDRRKLVELLAGERYLVPHDERKRPLRQIARETRSSYGRVAQCDAQFSAAVRRILESDPEFVELDRLRRGNPDGVDLPIDEAVDRSLAQRSADEFSRRFRGSDPAQRAELLRTLLECSGEDVEALVHGRVHRLSPELRERVLRAAPDASIRDAGAGAGNAR